jgi:uncharacterized integral membrane protein (TIGR00698 family)
MGRLANHWLPTQARSRQPDEVTVDDIGTEQRTFLTTFGWGRPLPGLAVTTAIALVATLIGRELPLLGAPVAAILVGVGISRFAGGRESLTRGISLSAKFVLQLSVVILGAQLSLRQVASVGLSSLPVMLGTLGACLAAAYYVGRRLGTSTELRTLIGVGTGICGASAIAATSPVIRAKNPDITYAITTIFCFNIVAVLVFPPLGHLLGLSQEQFGMFAGTAINDTSSVVAAATTYGAEAGNHAVVVKLTRTLMIIPICLVLGAIVARRDAQAADSQARKSSAMPRVPWFLVGFLAVAAINSAIAVPVDVHRDLHHVAVFLITIAMAGIGVSTDTKGLLRAGYRPLLLGGILWIVVSVSSLLIQIAGGSVGLG